MWLLSIWGPSAYCILCIRYERIASIILFEEGFDPNGASIVPFSQFNYIVWCITIWFYFANVFLLDLFDCYIFEQKQKEEAIY